MQPAPLQWCDRPGARHGRDGERAADTSERVADEGGGQVVACAACHHPITTAGERIEVNGRHEHDQVNPDAYGFHFGCFAHAPGVVERGAETDHWSWFSGYRWRVACCRGCAVHLGWRFLSSQHRFYGLILDRLIELDDDAA